MVITCVGTLLWQGKQAWGQVGVGTVWEELIESSTIDTGLAVEGWGTRGNWDKEII